MVSYVLIYSIKLCLFRISILISVLGLFFLSSCSSVQSRSLLLSWPLNSKSHHLKSRISRGFSYRNDHYGIDVVASMHRDVLSAHEGYVIYAGNDYRGYGRLVIIDSGQGWSTFYAHLDRIFVKEGALIQRGSSIGTIGMTGRTSGPHLHFELRKNKKPIDPQKYLP